MPSPTADLIQYTLHLADNALILGHRNSEWTGHGPILEQDIALSNISLDLIGQARYFYQYAATLRGDGATEDSLAYLRDSHEFLNCLMAEQEKGDWGFTIMRQFFFSAYLFPLYEQLRSSDDQEIAAIAEKSLKEVTYHLRWSSEWVIRLGRGTEESARRMQAATDALWVYTDELTTPAAYEFVLLQKEQAGIIRTQWQQRVQQICDRAGLQIQENIPQRYGGKSGSHSDALKTLLEEMQYLQRTYPGVEW